METSGSRARKAFLTALGIGAALAAVAIAARGSTPAGDDESRAPSDALLDVLFSLYLAALAGGAVAFVYLLVLRRRVKAQRGHAPRRTLLELLATLAVLGGFALLAARRLEAFERRPPPNVEEDLIGRGGELPPATTVGTVGAEQYEAEIAWIPVLATMGLILLAVVAWWLSGRARRRARGEVGTELAAAVTHALEESLDDLRAEPDARRAVIAAYARLERVLAAQGLPRRPAEAPLEYLGRMLAALSVGERAARALTELFERAKFSQHEVGPAMKEQAIAALETVRDDVLAARALADEARAAVLESARERTAT